MSKSSSALRVTSKDSKTRAASAPTPTAKPGEGRTQTKRVSWGQMAIDSNNRMKTDPVFAAKIAKKIF